MAKRKKSILSRKEKLIISAIELLNEGGVNGLTTKELAKSQGITEPAIYRQFESKKEILMTIISYFESFDDAIMNTITEQGLKGKEALTYFMTRYIEYYDGYEEIATVFFSFDMFKYDEDTLNMMKSILDKRRKFLISLINEVKNDIILKLDIEAIADFLEGYMLNTIYRMKMFGFDEPLSKSTRKTIEGCMNIIFGEDI